MAQHAWRTYALAACICVLAALTALPGCTNQGGRGDSLFQLSSIGALMAGVLDGEMTCKELKTKGNTGIGTFNGLDGEMLCLDGVVWQVRTDGVPVRADQAQKLPFAVAAFFTADETVQAENISKLSSLGLWLDEQLSTPNIMYAARITGDFTLVKTRSVPAQQKPYPPLSEAVANQTVFELKNVRGAMVGFRFPAYMSGVNVSGWHFHFITDDHSAGGHVLDCSLDAATVQIDELHGFDLRLPSDSEFYTADLGDQSQDSIKNLF